MSSRPASAGVINSPRNRASAKALVELATQHKTRNCVSSAFHIREDVFKLTSVLLENPKESLYDIWWLKMVQQLSITIADDDIMAALPECGWEQKTDGVLWYPPEDA